MKTILITSHIRRHKILHINASDYPNKNGGKFFRKGFFQVYVTQQNPFRKKKVTGHIKQIHM